MTALTASRLTPRRSADRIGRPVSLAAVIYAGSLVALLDADGTAVPAGTAGSGHAIGVADRDVDGSAPHGPHYVEAECGCWRFENSTAGDEIAHVHIGQPAYIVDDQTVALTDGDGTRKLAGAIFDVDDEGVWIDVRPGAVGPRGLPGEPA